MISIENMMHQQQHQSVNGGTGPPATGNIGMSNGGSGGAGGGGIEHPGMVSRGMSGELPTAYVTSMPLPMAKAQQLHQMQMQHHQGMIHGQPMNQNMPHHLMHQNPPSQTSQDSGEKDDPSQMAKLAESQKNARIASLFEEIRLEAKFFGSDPGDESPDVKQELMDDEDQPTELAENAPKKKLLKKRKSEQAIEMTADDVDDILGETPSNPSNFNPKNPFGGPSPSGLSNGYADLGSPGSSSLKSSPPLPKYTQNNQGQRNSPPSQGFPTMSPYMTPQMNSPLHPQLQQSNSVSSPPVTMHSPGQPDFKPTIINGHVMNPLGHPPLAHHHHLPHHTRFLQHQQSAPNLRLGTPDDQKPPQPMFPYNGQGFDMTLVEEFNMCVRSVMMAANRVYCRHVYRQLTAEVSELYARVAKNQVPKKAVKKIVAARQPANHGERIELERQFKCLSDGLESRQQPQLYESILNFLYKMRVAIPDANQ